MESVDSSWEIKDLESVLMTTDGLMLARQLVALQRAGLDGLNISLDTLQSQRYNQITRRKGWERVMVGIDLALQLEYDPVKINCVVMRGFNEDEVCSFVELTKEKNVDVRFIEYMPFSGNKWNDGKMVSFSEMVQIIRKQWPNFDPLPNGPNDTSKACHVPGFKGRVGFITSMSEHFCGTCNRLQITADGNLEVCLFGYSEISLRDAIRSKCSEDDLLAMIGAAVRRKKKIVTRCPKSINFISLHREAAGCSLSSVVLINGSSSLLAQRHLRIFTSGKDEIGLIVLGSDKTQNPLGYPNVSVEFPLALPTWQMISFVEKALHESEIKTDWIDGVVVGMQVLKDELACLEENKRSRKCLNDNRWPHVDKTAGCLAEGRA
ncbi:molybdenum cofactor biosynthesis protein 1-like [Schistocerca americana]|uniref:molybdenum cofactor biosynthesis protein 1-like n=1 Tax=Schistocerca americana TaxID=7009 RepID=UPI001F4F19BF|nr:molybdenum cofactor biosynthesis protein 1-like [Schistocerca americana]